MLKMLSILLVGLSVAAGAGLAQASDVTGTWNFHVELSLGSGDPTFVLKQDGEKLTGTYEGTFGSAPVTGMVRGDAIEFSFDVQGQKAVYKGKITGAKMEGTCDYGPEIGDGTWTAEKAG